MLETSPLTSFSASFLKKNISYVLLTDQSLLLDFEKLHKILKKIPVKFARTPLLQVASELVEYQVIVSKGVLHPLPFLRHPSFDPVCPHFLKPLFPFPLFCPTPFQGILDSPTILKQPTPALIQPTKLPWFKQISKR